MRGLRVSVSTRRLISMYDLVLRLPFSLLTFPKFNRFWLDAGDPESFPPGLLEALEELWSSSSSAGPNPDSLSTDPGAAARLKAQIQADALRPLNISSVENEEEGGERPLRMGTGADSDRNGSDDTVAVPLWPEETLLQVGDYLRLSVSLSLSGLPPIVRAHASWRRLFSLAVSTQLSFFSMELFNP